MGGCTYQAAGSARSANAPDSSAHASITQARKKKTGWRIMGGLILIAVLSLSFIGHLTPGMRLQWANFMSLCGF